MKVILGLVALFCSVSAFALGIDFVGGANTSTVNNTLINPQTSVSTNAQGGSGYEYGVLIESGGHFFGLQTGALYIQRQDTVNLVVGANTVSANSTWNSIEIPLLLRLHALPFLVIGAGGAYYLGQGQITYKQTDPGNIAGGNASGSASYSDYGRVTNDFAAVASAEIDVPLAPTAHLLLRADYQYGLTNLDNSGTYDQKISVLSYMGGLGFSF
jgi:hypothetical protein